jgi:hybrid cluster-associated redox disulfide protein
MTDYDDESDTEEEARSDNVSNISIDTEPTEPDIDVTDSELNTDKKPSGRPINKSMLIVDIIDEHPDVIPLLLEKGMHCIGCGASMFETLEEGFMGHGMDDREIEKIMDELNAYIKEISK